MKLFILALFAVVVATEASPKDAITKLIERIRSAIPEPITLKHYDAKLPKNDFLEANITLDDVNITGIKAFKLNLDWYNDIIPKGLNFGLDNVIGSGSLDAELAVPQVNFRSDVKLTLAVTVQNLQAVAKLDLDDDKEMIQKLTASFDKIQVLLKGDLNGNTKLVEDINKVINYWVNLIHSNLPKYSEDVRKFLNNLINNLIPKSALRALF